MFTYVMGPRFESFSDGGKTAKFFSLARINAHYPIELQEYLIPVTAFDKFPENGKQIPCDAPPTQEKFRLSVNYLLA